MQFDPFFLNKQKTPICPVYGGYLDEGQNLETVLECQWHGCSVPGQILSLNGDAHSLLTY